MSKLKKKLWSQFRLKIMLAGMDPDEKVIETEFDRMWDDPKYAPIRSFRETEQFLADTRSRRMVRT